jgi:hypothetical protein
MVQARRRGRASDFHEWRKAAKRLWYELRLIEATGGRIRSDARALDRLETWLGNDHNAVVLCSRMAADARLRRAGPDLDALHAVIDRHQAGLRRKALALGARLYARSPRRYVAELKRLWRRWKK